MAMLSKIRIGRNDDRDAVIKIDLAASSEDMNDDVLKEFINDFKHISYHCSVEFKGGPEGFQTIHIKPIRPADLFTQAHKMLQQVAPDYGTPPELINDTEEK